MSRSSMLLLIAAALAPVATSAQGPAPLTLHAVRFYRADGQKTLVKAFVEVPAQLGEPIAAGRTDSVRYQVALRIVDSAGLTLINQSWGRSLLNEPGAAGVDIIEFPVTPGHFRLEATVLDAAGQRKAQTAVDVDGYRSQPEASDLLLAPAMRVSNSATDTVPGPGELRRGNTLVVATARLHLTPLRTHAYYLLEAYNPTELDQTGSMHVAVADSTGKTLTETRPVAVRIGPGGGLLKGQLDLEGLPAGRYAMTVSVDMNGKSVQRTAEFTMAGLEATVRRNAELTRVAMTTDEGYFGSMNEAQLDSAATPLGYVATSGERSQVRGFNKLTPAAKRRFLTEFWARRDPDKRTQVNEGRQHFYDAIAFANRTFGEGTRRPQPGWKTDRGRIYAKNGAPDDILRRTQASSGAPPYEVWQYTRGKNRYYIFADRTGFGAFNLLKTNDQGEANFPDWADILKADAVRDIGRYLGVDFFSGDAGSSSTSGS